MVVAAGLCEPQDVGFGQDRRPCQDGPCDGDIGVGGECQGELVRDAVAFAELLADLGTLRRLESAHHRVGDLGEQVLLSQGRSDGPREIQVGHAAQQSQPLFGTLLCTELGELLDDGA